MDEVKQEAFIAKFSRHIFTGKDGRSFDIGRVALAFGLLSYVFFEGLGLYHGQTFDPMQYAGGFGAILAAGGALLKLKENTEPEPEEHHDHQ